jgi:phosphoglucosamine mutase
MTSEIALRVGMAVAHHFGGRGRVVVGKDTRLSGYLFETALASGLCAVGAQVMLVGPLPTPGIAYIVRSMRADAGVVISASHNPYQDNGIKIFGADGYKLPDAVEAELEAIILGDPALPPRASADKIGRAIRIDDASGRYLTHVKQTFPDDFKLDGLKIVVDCAHGAAYRFAAAVFAELGAEVVAIGDDPDGCNINDGVGATHPEVICAKTREHEADLGIALDGDADRVIVCDHRGNLVDGDAIMAILARDRLELGQLPGRTVVATVMSNLGLERALASFGAALVRTQVGDRYVLEAMRAGGFTLGGEQSGHILCLEHTTTGDGLVAALQILAVMQRRGQKLADLAKVFTHFPQRLRNLKVARRVPIADLPVLNREIAAVESDLGGDGRVVIRFSGTEKKLRIMVEAASLELVDTYLDRLEAAALRELGRAEST